MQEIGRVLSVRDKNILVLRSTRPPGEGSRVYDENQQQIGVVEEVMGPVRAPFVLVKARENPEQYVGRPLYH